MRGSAERGNLYFCRRLGAILDRCGALRHFDDGAALAHDYQTRQQDPLHAVALAPAFRLDRGRVSLHPRADDQARGDAQVLARLPPETDLEHHRPD